MQKQEAERFLTHISNTSNNLIKKQNYHKNYLLLPNQIKRINEEEDEDMDDENENYTAITKYEHYTPLKSISKTNIQKPQHTTQQHNPNSNW